MGFISGDLRVHSVAHFFEPIASAHDRSAFEYVLCSNSNYRDEVSERLRSYADHWRDVWHMSDEAVVELIDRDCIDILVDLSGHTAFNRLAVFARRAAPVQISYLGYPDSTGLPTMDYRITDAATDRPATRGRLITFGSFNSLAKISDTLHHCWGLILGEAPAARLRLTRVRSPQRASEIVAVLGGAGVAADRIDSVPDRGEPPHGSQFAGVDIALDHYPYNGVTTTCESLYAGVPVISLHGRNGVSRSGLGLLGTVGLGELAADSPSNTFQSRLRLPVTWRGLNGCAHRCARASSSRRCATRRAAQPDSRNYCSAPGSSTEPVLPHLKWDDRACTIAILNSRLPPVRCRTRKHWRRWAARSVRRSSLANPIH